MRDTIAPYVMAGLVPAIHALAIGKKDVDARAERGHDGDRFVCCVLQAKA